MAEKAKKAKTKARGSGKARATAKPKRASAAAKPRKRAPSKPEAAREAVESTAKDADGTVSSAAGKLGQAAGKVKVPLMAGGAALAGAAGGIALGARQAHRKSGLGVSSKDLAKAARKAGDVGAQVGEIALEVRRARETTNGNGRHRSPIEVVLQGLTSRGPRG
jgi:GNAT superfamily N-acetyltransferase